MIACNYLTDIYPKEYQGRCAQYRQLIDLEKCAHCHHRLFTFSEMKIGRFYYNSVDNRYCIKISETECFDLNKNEILPVNFEKAFAMLCDYEVW